MGSTAPNQWKNRRKQHAALKTASGVCRCHFRIFEKRNTGEAPRDRRQIMRQELSKCGNSKNYMERQTGHNPILLRRSGGRLRIVPCFRAITVDKFIVYCRWTDVPINTLTVSSFLGNRGWSVNNRFHYWPPLCHEPCSVLSLHFLIHPSCRPLSSALRGCWRGVR